jgi:hypothetical protein
MNTSASNGQVSDLFVEHRTTGFPAPLRPAPEPKAPQTLSELVQDFDQTAASHNPDIDVPVRALTMTERANVIVPDLGPCALTPWAKKQFASRLGIQWDRWFDGIDGKLRADEVNRRLSRDAGKIRVKAKASSPPNIASTLWHSTSSNGSVSQQDVATKWCTCSTSSGATRELIGCMLLRSPGSSRPMT